MTRTIGIFVFDGVEVLDFAGPYEVFTCASRVHSLHAPGAPAPFQVRTTGHSADMVRARAGLSIFPETDFATTPCADVIIIPGGVVDAELAKPAVIDWIAQAARGAELTASVCTGSYLLAQAGLLDGLDATTHWDDIEGMRARFPQVRTHGQRRWVDCGRIVTSAGISAGIDMSLHLVERLVSRDLALATAHRMEYDWNEA